MTDFNSDYQNELINFIFNKPGSKLSSEQAPDVQRSIDIYRNNLFENAYRALSISFPTVEHLIGRRAFRTLLVNLLQAESKTQFDWADYGKSFRDCIEKQDDLAAYPYLSEVAELDWIFHQAERKKDIEYDAQSFALLESEPLESLCFVTNTGFELKRFWFPVSDIRELAHEQTLTPQQKKALKQQLEIKLKEAVKLEQPRSFLIWRPEFKPVVEEIDHDEALICNLLSEGASASDVIRQVDALNLNLTDWLSRVIASKKIVGVKIK